MTPSILYLGKTLYILFQNDLHKKLITKPATNRAKMAIKIKKFSGNLKKHTYLLENYGGNL